MLLALALWPDGLVASGILLVAIVFALVFRGLRIHITLRDERPNDPKGDP